MSQWVLLLLEKGYNIQFGSWPPRFSSILKTVVDPEQGWVLEQEVQSLLAKDAMELIPPPKRELGSTAGISLFNRRMGSCDLF